MFPGPGHGERASYCLSDEERKRRRRERTPHFQGVGAGRKKTVGPRKKAGGVGKEKDKSRRAAGPTPKPHEATLADVVFPTGEFE